MTHRVLGGYFDDPGATRASAEGTSYEIPYRWQQDAACRDTHPSIFWPANGDYSAAAALCARCDVLGECLDAADWGEDAVFRAGLTGIQRKNLRRATRQTVTVRHCDLCGGGFIGTIASRYCGPICRREAATAQMRRRRG